MKFSTETETREMYRLDKKRILKYINPIKKTDQLLELGCSVGNTINMVHDICDNITGIDLSENSLKIAKKRFPNVNFYLNDMIDLKVLSQILLHILLALELINF